MQHVDTCARTRKRVRANAPSTSTTPLPLPPPRHVAMLNSQGGNLTFKCATDRNRVHCIGAAFFRERIISATRISAISSRDTRHIIPESPANERSYFLIDKKDGSRTKYITILAINAWSILHRKLLTFYQY